MDRTDGLAEGRKVTLIEEGLDKFLCGVDIMGNDGGGWRCSVSGSWVIMVGCIKIHGFGGLPVISRCFRGLLRVVGIGIMSLGLESHGCSTQASRHVVSEKDELVVRTKQADPAGIRRPDGRTVRLASSLGIGRCKSAADARCEHVRDGLPGYGHGGAGSKSRDPTVVVAGDKDKGG